MHLKQLLKVKRLEMHLTQVEVSRLLGLHPNYYQQIELGYKTPSFDILIKLCKILNIDIGELNQLIE